MASRTPARFLGLDSELGLIAPGYRADLVAFTVNFEVTDTWIAGMTVGSTSKDQDRRAHRGVEAAR